MDTTLAQKGTPLRSTVGQRGEAAQRELTPHQSHRYLCLFLILQVQGPTNYLLFYYSPVTRDEHVSARAATLGHPLLTPRNRFPGSSNFTSSAPPGHSLLMLIPLAAWLPFPVSLPLLSESPHTDPS